MTHFLFVIINYLFIFIYYIVIYLFIIYLFIYYYFIIFYFFYLLLFICSICFYFYVFVGKFIQERGGKQELPKWKRKTKARKSKNYQEKKGLRVALWKYREHILGILLKKESTEVENKNHQNEKER